MRYISIFIVLQVDGRLRTLSDLTHLHGMTCSFGACSTIRAQVPYFGDSHVPSFHVVINLHSVEPLVEERSN